MLSESGIFTGKASSRRKPNFRVSIPVLILMALAVAAPAMLAAQPAKVTLTFWGHNYEPLDKLTKVLIAEYQAKNPHVTIQFEVVPNDVQITKILAGIAGGQAPDIYDIRDTDLKVFTSRNALAEVDYAALGYKNMAALEKDWVPNSLNTFKDGGKLYGEIQSVNSWPLFINNRIFREAGLDPAKDYPKTWEQLGEIGAKLSIYKNGVWERQGFNWLLQHSGLGMIMYPPIVYQLGGSILIDDDRGNKSALTKPEAVKALQLMKDILYKYKAGGPGIAINTPADPNADFNQEKTAMWISGPFAVSTLAKYPDLYKNFTVVPLPQARDAKRHVVTSTSWAWVVNSKSKHIGEAWKFVDYMTAQAPRQLSNVGQIIPRLGWEQTPEAKAFPFLSTFLSELQYGRSRLQHPKGAEINAEVFKAIQRVILNDGNPEEALKAASIEIDKILLAK
jgi:multiple sugar transport system substrate-binding protein